MIWHKENTQRRKKIYPKGITQWVNNQVIVMLCLQLKSYCNTHAKYKKASNVIATLLEYFWRINLEKEFLPLLPARELPKFMPDIWPKVVFQTMNVGTTSRVFVKSIPKWQGSFVPLEAINLTNQRNS